MASIHDITLRAVLFDAEEMAFLVDLLVNRTPAARDSPIGARILAAIDEVRP